jgi:hypothetical protein
MDCINCPVSAVCLVADIIKKFSLQMNITVSNCQIKNCQPSTNTDIRATDIVTQPQPLKVYKDLREISDQMRDKEKGADCKVKILSDDTPECNIKVSCTTCGSETTSDDFKVCDGCHKLTCSNCRTESEGKIYCDDCWSNL